VSANIVITFRAEVTRVSINATDIEVRLFVAITLCDAVTFECQIVKDGPGGLD
jgi:hypothetical protein